MPSHKNLFFESLHHAAMAFLPEGLIGGVVRYGGFFLNEVFFFGAGPRCILQGIDRHVFYGSSQND